MSFPASKIFLVRPAKFGFNPQTAESNAFQVEVDLNEEEIQSKALSEFDAMVEKLCDLKIDVVVFEDTKEPYTPDSVFPNNWFSTHLDGTFCLYPMEALARRFERNANAIDTIKSHISLIREFDLTYFEEEGKFLEGTGSLVLDHENKIAYASISSRTNEEVLNIWAESLGFEIVKFCAFDQNGMAIYHTNVMMCLGDEFVVICLESIADENERKLLRETFRRTRKDVVEISFEQMNSFAGNMLLLQNSWNEKILVMSDTARNSLNENQIVKLESHAEIVSFDIDIIEKSGGGSVRCMIAEIF